MANDIWQKVSSRLDSDCRLAANRCDARQDSGGTDSTALVAVRRNNDPFPAVIQSSADIRDGEFNERSSNRLAHRHCAMGIDTIRLSSGVCSNDGQPGGHLEACLTHDSEKRKPGGDSGRAPRRSTRLWRRWAIHPGRSPIELAAACIGGSSFSDWGRKQTDCAGKCRAFRDVQSRSRSAYDRISHSEGNISELGWRNTGETIRH